MRKARSSAPSTRLDNRPHHWLPGDVAMLEDLADIATRLLDPDARALAAAAIGIESGGELVVDDDIVDLMQNYVAARRQDVVTLRAVPGAPRSRSNRKDRAQA